MNMTIEEIGEKKAKLESDINKLIRSFEEETDTPLSEIVIKKIILLKHRGPKLTESDRSEAKVYLFNPYESYSKDVPTYNQRLI